MNNHDVTCKQVNNFARPVFAIGKYGSLGWLLIGMECSVECVVLTGHRGPWNGANTKMDIKDVKDVKDANANHCLSALVVNFFSSICWVLGPTVLHWLSSFPLLFIFVYESGGGRQDNNDRKGKQKRREEKRRHTTTNPIPFLGRLFQEPTMTTLLQNQF